MIAAITIMRWIVVISATGERMLLKYVIKTIDFNISFCHQLSFKMSTSPFGPTFIAYTHLQTNFLSLKGSKHQISSIVAFKNMYLINPLSPSDLPSFSRILLVIAIKKKRIRRRDRRETSNDNQESYK